MTNIELELKKIAKKKALIKKQEFNIKLQERKKQIIYQNW